MIIEEKVLEICRTWWHGDFESNEHDEFKELCILKNYIIRQHIPCDLEIYFRDKHSGPSSEVVFRL